MKKYVITENEAGQRLDRFLGKLLPGAPASFFYKMLRKKNITVNGKKAEGSARLFAGDEIRLFLSDDTIAGFSRPDASPLVAAATPSVAAASPHMAAASSPVAAASSTVTASLTGVMTGGTGGLTGVTGDGRASSKKAPASAYHGAIRLDEKDIIFEDKDIIIINKTAGVLSQKAKADDISMNELLAAYMLERGELVPEDMRAFRPAVCNRLDRNTSGVILAGKSSAGLRFLSELIRERKIGKYYYAIVKGEASPPREVKAYLLKDERNNTVHVFMESPSADGLMAGKPTSGKPVEICTRISQLSHGGGCALLEIELVTGKSHQIRSQLAAIGHPVIGDPKYGDQDANKYFFKTCHVRRQLLHARRVVFPENDTFKAVSGKEFVAGLPHDFLVTLDTLGLNP
jgi:23S rRNA pseudouridine955/2504/2580 synthase